MARFRFPFLLRSGLSVVICASAPAQTPARSESPDAKAGVAATIGGKPVTTAELDEKILKANMKLAQQLYDARKAAIDEIVIDRALGEEAKGRNITVDQLLKERAASKVTPVNDADVQLFYEGNKGRFPGKTMEQAAPQIKSTLANQRESNARASLIAELKTKADVKLLLDLPRADVAVAANDPVKGPADAKVTIIEFSEFQ